MALPPSYQQNMHYSKVGFSGDKHQHDHGRCHLCCGPPKQAGEKMWNRFFFFPFVLSQETPREGPTTSELWTEKKSDSGKDRQGRREKKNVGS